MSHFSIKVFITKLGLSDSHKQSIIELSLVGQETSLAPACLVISLLMLVSINPTNQGIRLGGISLLLGGCFAVLPALLAGSSAAAASENGGPAGSFDPVFFFFELGENLPAEKF